MKKIRIFYLKKYKISKDYIMKISFRLKIVLFKMNIYLLFFPIRKKEIFQPISNQLKIMGQMKSKIKQKKKKKYNKI